MNLDLMTEFRPEDRITMGGEELLPPEDVQRLVGLVVGGTFSLKQVARLGNMGLLKPVLFKRRRLYRRKDVEAMLRRGDFILSAKHPSLARLARPERRGRRARPRKTTNPVAKQS